MAKESTPPPRVNQTSQAQPVPHSYPSTNVANRTIFCHDNLEILQGINSECIDLIYLDPPFNKKKIFTAPIGTSAEGASFRDIFTEEDVKDEWVRTIKEDYYKIHELLNAVKNIEGRTSYNFCYLAYMGIRLIECHRVLKETGSIYLHCDYTMSHYLKLLLDCVFSEKNLINEIIWCYHGPGSPQMKQFNRKSDTIFWYAKGKTWVFNRDVVRVPFKDPQQSLRRAMSTTNSFTPEEIEEYRQQGKIPENWWEMRIAARSKKENQHYPTQKPIALLERIISASSNAGGVVLDPFCGCATTCVAAEKLNREWIGVDISHKAYELVQQRLKKEVWGDPDALHRYTEGYPAINYSVSPPQRTDEYSGSRDRKHVYIISHPNYDGEYKVGVARDVRSRLSAYQTSDPDRRYKLEHSVETEHYRALEAHIHSIFENKHEWVRAGLTDIKQEMARFTPRVAGEEGLFDEAERAQADK